MDISLPFADLGPVATAALRGAILVVAALLWVVLLVRVVGLRSFSKMASFDFAMTVATGSLLASASQASEWPAFAQAMAALAALFFAQYLIAKVRRRWTWFGSAIENQPRLLMRDGVIFDTALTDARITRDDLMAKLREANVADPARVKAVVLETTGDVSVLHGDPGDGPPATVLLSGVAAPR